MEQRNSKPQTPRRHTQSENTSTAVEQLHIAWQRDIVTSGTGGESIRVSVIRQLSRVAGTLLAECSKDTGEATQLMRDALDLELRFDNYTFFINRTVQSITNTGTLQEATTHITRLWRQLGEQDSLSSKRLLCGVVAVAKWSCDQMLRDLTSRGFAGKTVYNRGDSELPPRVLPSESQECSIVVLHGSFSELLISHARDAEARYQMTHRPSRGSSRATERASQFQITEDFGLGQPNLTHRFVLSDSDFSQAYITATFAYAAGAYADRVKAGKPARSTLPTKIGRK